MNPQEYIKYRIPGEKRVLKTGMFQLIDAKQAPKGFIVTDFSGNKAYQLTENSNESAQNLEVPVVADKTAYLLTAQAYVEKLQKDGGKAVLSRIKKVQGPENIDEYFDALCEAYPKAFVYLIHSKSLGCWIGATPETLISVDKGVGRTMALAGTRKSGSVTPWTEKEFEEHELVADFIENSLEELSIDAIERSNRFESESGPVKHLKTEFQFATSEEDAWKVAKRLHPTPAVSGWPVSDALKLIQQHETHKRSLYAGMIGVIDDKVNLYVNLRCAENRLGNLYLYVGGGLTKDSDPEAEWEETENKAETLINVLKNG